MYLCISKAILFFTSYLANSCEAELFYINRPCAFPENVISNENFSIQPVNNNNYSQLGRPERGKGHDGDYDGGGGQRRQSGLKSGGRGSR